MEKLGSGLKKVLLAGIGAVAVTGEKSKELLDEMVKKGELTVEQGKALNEELKHNIKSTVKEKVNVKVKTSSPEELDELLDKMTPEQRALLKQRIDEMEKKQEEFEAAETVEDVTDESVCEDAAEKAAEEENIDGHGPLVGFFHDLICRRANIAEGCSQHHAGEKRGKTDFHIADAPVSFFGKNGQRYGQKDEGNRKAKPFGIGFEDFFRQIEQSSKQASDQQGQKNLQQRVDHHGDHINASAVGLHCLGNSKGDRKGDKSDSIVQSHHRQQYLCHLPFGFVLLHNHHGGSRSCRRGNGTQSQSR